MEFHTCTIDGLLVKIICDALHHLVPFAQFKNVKITQEGMLLLGLKPATLKVTLLHGCCSRFLNCANDTKLCKHHMNFEMWKAH